MFEWFGLAGPFQARFICAAELLYRRHRGVVAFVMVVVMRAVSVSFAHFLDAPSNEYRMAYFSARESSENRRRRVWILLNRE